VDDSCDVVETGFDDRPFRRYVQICVIVFMADRNRSTFRGKLKQMASEIAEHFYISTPDLEECPNQAQFQAAIKAQVVQWMTGGAYLHGEKDGSVRRLVTFGVQADL
jgi:hypothetical protein